MSYLTDTDGCPEDVQMIGYLVFRGGRGEVVGLNVEHVRQFVFTRRHRIPLHDE